MRYRLAGLVAGLLALSALAPALTHAGPATVTVRVLGLNQTLDRTTVTTTTTPVSEGGGSCSGTSDGGALDLAVGHANWSGTAGSGYYTLDSIYGEIYPFGSGRFWSIAINGLAAPNGVCYDELSGGDDVLFYAACDPYSPPPPGTPCYGEPLKLTAPSAVTPGTPFTVHVTETTTLTAPPYTSSTAPSAGATVTAGSATATTDPAGNAALTVTQPGPVTIKATKGDRAYDTRSACATNGADGFCGTVVPPPPPPPPDKAAPASKLGSSLVEGMTYAKGKGPRQLSGTASDPSGVLMVKLRITRTLRGHCSYFSGKKLTFVPMDCGAEHGRGSRSTPPATGSTCSPTTCRAGATWWTSTRSTRTTTATTPVAAAPTVWSSRSRSRWIRLFGAAALAAAPAAGLAACGVGVGAGASQPVGLLVTRDFGRRLVGGRERVVKAPSSDTVMRLLDRTHRVRSRFGGAFVQAIDGTGAGTRGGRAVDWFFYVDGALASRGAASVTLHPGDRVWWDLHDWTTTPDVEAVVGSFPEPFLHGRRGGPPPVRLQCAAQAIAACASVTRRLREIGAGHVTRAAVGTPSTGGAVRVLVGPWRALRADALARRLERGPAASGVYVRPAADGRTIGLLDARGRVARRVGAGTGLVAATADPGGPATWLVTGTDDEGVARAVAALNANALGSRFAVALPAAGDPVSLPASP